MFKVAIHYQRLHPAIDQRTCGRMCIQAKGKLIDAASTSRIGAGCGCISLIMLRAKRDGESVYAFTNIQRGVASNGTVDLVMFAFIGVGVFRF